MPKRSGKARDINAMAARIVSEATSEDEAVSEDAGKNPHAQALGRLGGLKGGIARAQSLTPEQRSDAARKAAYARWKPTE